MSLQSVTCSAEEHAKNTDYVYDQISSEAQSLWCQCESLFKRRFPCLNIKMQSEGQIDTNLHPPSPQQGPPPSKNPSGCNLIICLLMGLILR